MNDFTATFKAEFMAADTISELAKALANGGEITIKFETAVSGSGQNIANIRVNDGPLCATVNVTESDKGKSS